MSNCCKPGVPLVRSACSKDEINADFCDQSTSIPSSCVKSASCCEEQSHCEQVITQEFHAALKIQNVWNMPDCGETATLIVPGLTVAPVGGYLWKADIGYLEITAFSASRQTLVVRNNCQEGNAAAGTEIPACSIFVVTVPPADAQPPLFFPYVAIDFTAPANGDCLDITVTSVNGLQTGKKVQIGTGFYRLEAILSPTLITICNDGDGITPGTSVIAKTGEVYNYPIVLIDSNFCSNTASEEGVLAVCDGSAQVPLESHFAGGFSPALVVAPIYQPGTKTVVKPFPIDAGIRACTVLEAALGIIAAQAAYTLTIDSAPGFVVGNILEIEGRAELFTVTGTGVGTVDVTAAPVPGANATVPVGNWVCEQTCCDRVDTTQISSGAQVDLPEGIQTVPQNTTFTGSSNLWTVTNSELRPVKNISLVSGFVQVSSTNINPTNIAHVVELQISTDNGGTWTTVVQFVTICDVTTTTYTNTYKLEYHRIDQMAAGAAIQFGARIKVQNGATAQSIDLGISNTQVTHFAV